MKTNIGQLNTLRYQRAKPRRRMSVLVILLLVTMWLMPSPKTARAAGIPTVDVALSDSEAVNTETRVVVTFTPPSSIASGYIKIYLGPNTSGSEFTDGDTDQTGADIACTQTGATFSGGAFAVASATVPMLYSINTASGGDNSQVVCTLGSGATDGPSLPAVADGYSVTVVTNADAGAGVAYVGNSNDVTVSATVLPNLALTISNGAAGCTTALGVTTCNLGIVTPAAVNSANYRVGIGTNATGGAKMNIVEDGDLRNSTDTIDDVTGGTVTAGQEAYGIAAAATNGGGTWTLTSPYDSGDDPIDGPVAEVAASAGPIDITTSYVTVTHKVAVASTTKALTYSHIVTWTATATF